MDFTKLLNNVSEYEYYLYEEIIHSKIYDNVSLYIVFNHISYEDGNPCNIKKHFIGLYIKYEDARKAAHNYIIDRGYRCMINKPYNKSWLEEDEIEAYELDYGASAEMVSIYKAIPQ